MYDGDCEFCTRSVDVLRGMVGSSFEAVPYQRPGVLEKFPDLTEEACREEIKLVFSDSSHVGGAEAMFRLLLRHPLWRLVAWIYYLPPFGWIAEWVYRWVARQRRCMLGDPPDSD